MKSLMCFLFGHQDPVPMLIETDSEINTRACPRCLQPTAIPVYLKKLPPPPNSTVEQLRLWEDFKLKKFEAIRNSVVSEMKSQNNGDIRNRTFMDKLKFSFICKKKGHTVNRIHPLYPSQYCSVCNKHRSQF